MLLVLTGMITGSVLIIGEGRLGWTEMRECGRYVLGVCIGDVCVLCVSLVLIDESVGLGEGLVRYMGLLSKLPDTRHCRSSKA